MSLGEKYDYQMYQDQDNINVGLNAPYSKPFNWKFAVWDMTENKTLALAASRRNNLQNEDLIDTMKKIIERANNEIAR